MLETFEQELREEQADTPAVLDVFCGTGFVSQQIASHQLGPLTVIGVDGSKNMVEECQKWQFPPGDTVYCFRHIASECSKLKDQKFSFVTCHMGLFQVDLRSTMCLFQGQYNGKPELRTDKYQTLTWANGASFLQTLNSKEVGDFIKSYRDLIRCGRLL